MDGLRERKFRHKIETLLREGAADEAFELVRALLPAHCSASGPLPARALNLRPDDISFEGWPETLDWLCSLDRRIQRPITAIGIDISRHGHHHAKPDARGELTPHIETNFYSDATWPFSTSDRAALLQGYANGAAHWRGDFEDCAEFLGAKGMCDLYGALRRLDAKLERSPDEAQASTLAAMFIQVMLHLVVRRTAPRHAFPRPLAVLVGSNDEYPFFDAPVFTAKG